MDSSEFRRFFRACNPGKTIDVSDPQERKYYVDFTKVRGAEILEDLGRAIALTAPDPSCHLFTGHIGCGKSTELLRLKADLERQGFHVVYFESSQDLDMGDIDISDILLAIARRVGESLEAAGMLLQGSYFTRLLQDCANFLQTPIELGVEAEVSFGIGKLTAKTKESPQLRSQLRQYLEPRTESLLRAVNQELLMPAGERLEQQDRAGLVVIVDNLDRVDNRPMASGKTLPEYLFVDRGDQLRRLQCHMVYTIPLVMMFSNEYQALTNRLGGAVLLPMVPVRLKDGGDCPEGMALLQQMVLGRAFPDSPAEERRGWMSQLFDRPETCDRLCRVSGGHVRTLLGLLKDCLVKRDPLPIAVETLEAAIAKARDNLAAAVTPKEWALLHQIRQSKRVTGEEECQTLLRSLFVYEYRNASDGRWFDVNPLLEDASEMQ